MKIRLTLLLLVLVVCNCFAQAPKDALVERVDNTAFIQLEAGSFKDLTPQQKKVAYWLYQASIAVDPIIYDQLSQYGIREKRLLEEIAAHQQGAKPEVMKKVLDFAKLFWANRGNHNETTSQKFLPAFTFEELQDVAHNAFARGAMRSSYAALPPLSTLAALDRELAELKPSFFDPEFEPMITAKSPQGGKDILQSSSNTFYSNVTLADLKDFQEKYPLNSRLLKFPSGQLVEEVYRAGTPDGKVKPWEYSL